MSMAVHRDGGHPAASGEVRPLTALEGAIAGFGFGLIAGIVLMAWAAAVIGR